MIFASPRYCREFIVTAPLDTLKEGHEITVNIINIILYITFKHYSNFMSHSSQYP